MYLAQVRFSSLEGAKGFLEAAINANLMDNGVVIDEEEGGEILEVKGEDGEGDG
jgi:hypothetical protein